jgi:Type II restriction endonuclease EcoO109I
MRVHFFIYLHHLMRSFTTKAHMNAHEQKQLIAKAQEWFRRTILPKHLQNTRKLENPNEFDVNPFLAPYLAVYLTGELTPQSVAQALLYPRVLGSSITTSFGQNMQAFISEVLKNSFGSTTQGIDIEFVDCTDKRRKYCQVKLGPNTINKDDVATVIGHFKAVRNLGRTNNVAVRQDDMIVGILYGEPGQESSHYKAISTKHDYPVFIGQDFWHRLTGSKDFYQKLIRAISDVALEAKGTEVLNEVVDALAASDTVKQLAKKT